MFTYSRSIRFSQLQRLQRWIVERCLYTLFLAFLLVVPSYATTVVNIGVLSYDIFIPAGAGPGVNVFAIANLTGDPALGGFALPPEFPVAAFLTFSNSSLNISSATSSTNFALGPIGPGFFSNPALQFPDTDLFTGAVFTADVPSSFLLLDGTRVTVPNQNVVVQLVPASGVNLSPGTDFALISVAVDSSGSGTRHSPSRHLGVELDVPSVAQDAPMNSLMGHL